MDKMKYYKVVDKQDLGSARTENDNEVSRVIYKLNEFVFAPRTKTTRLPTRLFVFGSLEEAKDFAWPNESIYECEVLNPIKLQPCSSVCDFSEFWKEVRILRRLKKEISLKTQVINRFNFCYGCTAVKLVKLVG